MPMPAVLKSEISILRSGSHRWHGHFRIRVGGIIVPWYQQTLFWRGFIAGILLVIIVGVIALGWYQNHECMTTAHFILCKK